MTAEPDSRRRMIRLRGYDYSQPGVYFITVCTARRAFLFGEIQGGQMWLNDAGNIAQSAWNELPAHYAGLETDAFVVMPNHVHGILVLHNVAVDSTSVGAGLKPAPTGGHGLPEIVRGFKTFSARHVNESRGTKGSVWQRGYYDHIVRRGESLDRIRRYIIENPARWDFDPENPQAIRPAREGPWANF